MRRLLAGLGLALVAVSAVAQSPVTPPSPNSDPNAPKGNFTVIRPRAPMPLVEGADRPGFITIRPRGMKVPTPDGRAELAANATRPTAPQPPGNPPAKAAPAAPVTPPAAPPAADEGEGKLLHDEWYALFLKGMKAGYYHVVVREYVRDGVTYRYATKTQKLTVARFGQPAEIWGEDSTLETDAGKVLTTRMRQGLGKNQMLSLAGTADGKRLKVKIEGLSRGEEAIPFPEGVLGIAGEASLYPTKQPKPGDAFEYKWWEGRVNRVVTFKVKAIALEDLVIYTGQPPVPALRVEVAMDPIAGFKLPTATLWLDATTFATLRMDADDTTLGGKVTVLRTTRDFALTRPAKLVELNETQSIPLPQAIPDIHTLPAVTYTFALKEGTDPAKAFVADARQTLDGPASAVKMTVRAIRSPAEAARLAGGAAAANPGTEYLGDSFFIDWDNDLVRGLAKQAVAGLPAGAGAWDRAKAVERWVHDHMKAAEYSQAMATCKATAESRTGDCTEYAMLAAGLCRAAGVPSRTAIGLVYAPGRGGKPTLAYHMWAEVFADGHWLAIDATLGQGGVGPGHVKITDASWHDEKSLTPLLPVLGLLASGPKVTAVSVGK
jgi:transglutaminase-like putative cysteine protease